jgi:hypothetical protein
VGDNTHSKSKGKFLKKVRTDKNMEILQQSLGFWRNICSSWMRWSWLRTIEPIPRCSFHSI